MGLWERFDQILTKVEKKGFNFANKAHMWTINVMLIGLAYGTYTIFRDYNEFFLAGRNPNYLEQEDQEGELREEDINTMIERKQQSK
mmetsp:Transcript_7111/g.8030  ORF Transcript_7111/g.8030 Transcript_7111/m.8030 type:complete len:87 (+) Transcript_7111:33-293(+)